MKCSAEWEIGIAFGIWIWIWIETQSEIESGTESGTQYEIEWLPRYESADCSWKIAVCSLFVAAKNVNFNS